MNALPSVPRPNAPASGDARPIRHGGLFEGYGGTTMAAALALGPLDTRWVSDIKPASVRLLAHRHPSTPNIGDMTEAHFRRLETIELLTASWPCQPHSSAGKRLGSEDPRALWPDVARAIADTRPAVFLGENVARITSNGELGRAVRSLADLGYLVAWRVLAASDIGAPHQRKRCFVAAVDPAADPDVLGRLAQLDELPAGQPDALGRRGGGDDVDLLPTPGERLGGGRGMPSVATATARMAAGRRNLDDAVALLPTPTARDHKGRTMHEHRVGTVRPQGRVRAVTDGTLCDAVALLPTPRSGDAKRGGTDAGRGHRDHKGGAGPSLPEAVHLLPTPRESDGTNGGPSQQFGRGEPGLSAAVQPELWGRYALAVARWEQVLGRPAPAPTQPSRRAGGAPQLAPPFVEWMMGLPQGWVCDVPDLAARPAGHRPAALSLLGDGVVPLQGGTAFRELLGHLARRLAQGRSAAA